MQHIEFKFVIVNLLAHIGHCSETSFLCRVLPMLCSSLVAFIHCHVLSLSRSSPVVFPLCFPPLSRFPLSCCCVVMFLPCSCLVAFPLVVLLHCHVPPCRVPPCRVLALLCPSLVVSLHCRVPPLSCSSLSCGNATLSGVPVVCLVYSHTCCNR